MNTQHTPTPWNLNLYNLDAPGYFKPADVDVGGKYRFRVGDVSDRHADAAFIVRACNAHDEMVAALRKCESMLSDGLPIGRVQKAALVEAARAALAKAGAA